MALVPLRKGHAGSDPELAMRINDMTALIDSTIQTVRRIASDLRPAILDEFGLLAALEWQAHEFQKRTGIVCHFNLNTDEPTLELDRESTTAIFRVFQESLTNIARHAHATEVTATLERQADSLSLSVHDNGQGIRLGELNNLKSLGLVGMRERMRQVAGALDIRSAPGQGTTVLIRIPLIKPEPVG
jgi:signal transduction histidine kinase